MFFGECVYRENASDKTDIPWCTMRKHCPTMTILYHVIENTVADTIKAIYTQCMMGRSDVILLNVQWLYCILIGCVFYGMFKNLYTLI